MRLLPLLVLLALVPLAAANTQQGATVGVNLGYIAPGAWDIYSIQHAGGGLSLSLSWAASLFPGADYDLHLYRPGSSADGTFTPNERVGVSQNRTFATHTESISGSYASGRYYVAVVPFQTQGEIYTLSSSGTLVYQQPTAGYIARCPPFPC